MCLAGRVDALLGEVQDWPLCGAVDYLMENGLALLEDWHPLQSHRMTALRRRLVRVLRRGGILPFFPWRLFAGQGGAALLWCKQRGRDWFSWRLSCRSGEPQPFWSLSWPSEERLWIPLEQVVHLGRGHFSEEWFCQVAILLWVADGCYRRK